MARNPSRLEGFAEARRQLVEMGKAAAKGVGKRSLAYPAELLARRVRQNIAPHNLTGDTYESVDVEPAKQKGGVAVQVVLADIAGVQLEFGNSDQPASPVFRPAVDHEMNAMFELFGAVLPLEIEATILRRARRRSRQ